MKQATGKELRSPCHVCEKMEWRLKYHIDGWDIWACRSCGFARLHPFPPRQTREAFYSGPTMVSKLDKKRSGIRKFSASFKQLFNQAIRRDKNLIFYRRLIRYLPRGAKILDIGCGMGTFLERCKERFVCTGNDISTTWTSWVGKSNDVEIVAGDFLTVPFGQRKFDGITMIALLEHLDDPDQVLRKCLHLLNDGGVLLLKTVNYDCWNRRIMGGKWTGFRPPDHLIYPGPSNLRRLLQKIGFSQVRISVWPFSDNMYCDARK